MFRWIAFILAAACVVIGATAAYPQGCLPLAAAEAEMTRYGEEHFAIGMTDGRMMRLYVNPTTRTWTMFSVTAEGLACSIDDGSDFETVRPASSGKQT